MKLRICFAKLLKRRWNVKAGSLKIKGNSEKKSFSPCKFFFLLFALRPRSRTSLIGWQTARKDHSARSIKRGTYRWTCPHVLFDSFQLGASRIFDIRFRKFRCEPCAPISRQQAARWHVPDASLDSTLNSNRARVGVGQTAEILTERKLNVSYRIVSYRRNYELGLSFFDTVNGNTTTAWIIFHISLSLGEESSTFERGGYLDFTVCE